MTLLTCDIKPFVLQVTAQDPPTANSIQLPLEELQRYLERLREAICTDLQALEERITTLEQRVDACCGSS